MREVDLAAARHSMPQDHRGIGLEEAGAGAHGLDLFFARLLRDGFVLSAAGDHRSFADVAVGAVEFAVPQATDQERQRVLQAFEDLAPQPDAEPALARLRPGGVRVVALTSGAAAQTKALLERVGLDDRVEQVAPTPGRRHPTMWASASVRVGVLPFPEGERGSGGRGPRAFGRCGPPVLDGGGTGEQRSPAGRRGAARSSAAHGDAVAGGRRSDGSCGCVPERGSPPAAGAAAAVVRCGEGRRVRGGDCWDGMVAGTGGPGSCLVRLVRAVNDPITSEHELRLGGLDNPAATWVSPTATVGGTSVIVVGGRSAAVGGWLRTQVDAVPDRWSGFAVAFDGSASADAEGMAAALATAEADLERMFTDIRGGAVPDEREIEAAGWAGSQPVRVGNGARDQVQYDGLGLLPQSVSVYLQTGGSRDRATWDLVRSTADELAGDVDRVTNGIWELREPLPLVDGDIGRWLALDVALWIARLRHPLTRRRHWKTARDAARSRVLDAIGADGGLPQSWSHMEAARAMYVLDVARIRHRWGPLGLAAWRVTRYIQLRWFHRPDTDDQEHR